MSKPWDVVAPQDAARRSFPRIITCSRRHSQLLPCCATTPRTPFRGCTADQFRATLPLFRRLTHTSHQPVVSNVMTRPGTNRELPTKDHLAFSVICGPADQLTFWNATLESLCRLHRLRNVRWLGADTNEMVARSVKRMLL